MIIPFLGILFAVFFYRAADYERMNPLLWALASVGLTAIIAMQGSWLGQLFMAQGLLFVGMWWYNVRRHKKNSFHK